MDDRVDAVEEWGEESFPASDPTTGWQGPEEYESGQLARTEGDERAVLDYRIEDGRLLIVHTGVPESMAHHGVGGELVDEAVGIARDRGLVVVPRCPFARHWLSHHPEARAAVRIDWSR